MLPSLNFEMQTEEGKVKVRAILGQRMYPLVLELAKDASLAPKVTGMLIDLQTFSVREIVDMISQPELLAENVEDALNLIRSTDQEEQ